MFEAIRYSAYLGVAIYNDNPDCGIELVIDFNNGSVYYANQYIQYPPEHFIF